MAKRIKPWGKDDKWVEPKEWPLGTPEVIGRIIMNTDALKQFVKCVKKSDQYESDIFQEFLEFLSERIATKAKRIESAEATGSDGEDYEINIYSYGEIFFVVTSGFDQRGYFLAFEEARHSALELQEAINGGPAA